MKLSLCRKAAHLVSSRIHDQAVHRFHGPAALDEFGCEIIQQFRVGWRFARKTEITRRSDNAGVEVTLPNSIHHYPRRERILRRSQPSRELQPPTASGNRRLHLPGEYRGKTFRHLLTQI